MRTIVKRDNEEHRRRAVRRLVAVECDVSSDQWEGVVSLPITDLSARGLWVKTLLTLEAGEEVMVSFTPPQWPNRSPLVALATVSRVGMFRRRADVHESGMGLAFSDIDTYEARILESALSCFPPRLPTDRPEAGQLSVPTKTTRRSDSPILILDDGQSFFLRAEYELLTGNRNSCRKKVRTLNSKTSLALPASRHQISPLARFAA
jgi:hypothetical protein